MPKEQARWNQSSATWRHTTHKYSFGENNLAIVTSGGAEEDRDDASTNINCYVPTISKTANGSYDEVHDWEVFKTGAAAQKKFAGTTASFSTMAAVMPPGVAAAAFANRP